MKLTVQIVIYNNKEFLPNVIQNLYLQTFKDFQVMAVICGNQDGSKEYLESHYPQIKILDPKKNLGFAGGHNLAFGYSDSELVFLLNPDLVMEENYLELLVKAFEDQRIASVTGKLFQIDMSGMYKKDTLDSTGIVIYSSGRARDRGQHEQDLKQYDSHRYLPAVSGAGPMYRRSALMSLKQEQGEIFDTDFFMYWEDVDLGLRLLHLGYLNYFVPEALAFHGRGTGASKGGVKKIGNFLKHRETISLFTRKLNFQNHLFLIIKNYPSISFSLILREFAVFMYVLLLETKTLLVVPELISKLPQMFQKRQSILSKSKLSSKEFSKYFQDSN